MLTGAVVRRGGWAVGQMRTEGVGVQNWSFFADVLYGRPPMA